MAISKIITNSINDGSVTISKLSSTTNIVKPSITSPANNATDINNDQLITASPYLSLYGRSQANAEWQISTSPTFAYINVASTITGSNTQFQANASSGLVTNTIHYARVRYSDDANNYSEYSDTVQFTTATAFSFEVDFLVIAGGGGGGSNGGGGGAGGYREFSGQSIFPETNYTVTVGAGGAAGVYPSPPATNGSNSVFSNITSAGGGYGGGSASPAVVGGGNGGSGGGGKFGEAPGSGNTPSVDPSQGNNGGGSSGLGFGGGGGAGAAGAAGSSAGGGNGGTGTASSITGSSVTRAGGGGGGVYYSNPAGTGGAGGGGNAGNAGGAGSPGTNNTGGGGGGGGSNGTNLPNGAAGGSGIVIIKYPDSKTIANPGGGLTYTTSTAGGFTVATFTAGTGNVSWS